VWGLPLIFYEFFKGVSECFMEEYADWKSGCACAQLLLPFFLILILVVTLVTFATFGMMYYVIAIFVNFF
jgi:hypothetical protein